MWLARDKSGLLCVFEDEPKQNDKCFCSKLGYYISIRDNNIFPEITWENSPQRIEEVIRKEILKAANDHASGMFGPDNMSNVIGFITDVEWSNKMFLERACKWLDNNLYTTYDMFNNTGIDSVDGYTVEKLIEEFRKAMKNEI